MAHKFSVKLKRFNNISTRIQDVKQTYLHKTNVDESGSDTIKEIVHKATVISTSKVAYAEARSAFARKQRDDGFSAKVLRKIVEDFNRERES